MFQVADLIITEFFDQGDKERSELKIQPQVKTILTLRIVHECLCIIKFNKGFGKAKRDKMYVWQRILSLFRNKFDKVNSKRAQELHYIYHMTLKYLKNRICLLEKNISPLLCNALMDVIMQHYEICEPLVFIEFIALRHITPTGDVM